MRRSLGSCLLILCGAGALAGVIYRSTGDVVTASLMFTAAVGLFGGIE